VAYCYSGKVLDVNLSNGTVSIRNLPLDDADLFIGGSGLAAKIIFDEVDPSVDPLSPDNVLVFMTGPLTGTMVPGGSRYTVAAKSPLTGGWGEAHAGGYWGVELKKAGFDGVIVRGASDHPVYLWICDGEAEIRDASKYWGLDTRETDLAIKSDLKDDKVHCVVIGPAGERMVRLACILADVTPHGPRALGRTGMGAVMGSKKLKAIAVRGGGRIEVANSRKLREYVRRTLPSIMNFPTSQIQATYGTSGEVEVFYEYGDMPIKNFSLGKWDGIEKLRGEVLAKTYPYKGSRACFACPIACWKYIEVRHEVYGEIKGAAPEYEAVASLGSLLLIDDPFAIAKSNDLCNRYGIDVISTGVVLAWLFECFEKGLIDEAFTDGIKPLWGDPKAVHALIEKIGRKEGIGALLGEGVRIASRKVKGSESFAAHVKGLEVPMHDPRAFKGMGLQYATSNRGACHMYGVVMRVEQGERIPDLGIHRRVYRFDYKGKGWIVARMEDWHEVLEALGVCKFIGYAPWQLISMYSLATNTRTTVEEMIQKGTRIFTLKRIFNLACGAKDDTLPERFLKEPLNEGGAAGQVVELKPMLEEYYEYRKWTSKGIPTKELLEELDLYQMVRSNRYRSTYEKALNLET